MSHSNPEVARRITVRHNGVGYDGYIFITGATQLQFTLRFRTHTRTGSKTYGHDKTEMQRLMKDAESLLMELVLQDEKDKQKAPTTP
jgi:hypothetical protein